MKNKEGRQDRKIEIKKRRRQKEIKKARNK